MSDQQAAPAAPPQGTPDAGSSQDHVSTPTQQAPNENVQTPTEEPRQTGPASSQPGFDPQAFFNTMQQAMADAKNAQPDATQAEPPAGDGQQPDSAADEALAKANTVPEHWDKYDIPENTPAAEALKKMATAWV